MDADLERRYEAWLDTPATCDPLRAAFEAGAAAKSASLGEPAAYCVFCFRTVLVRAAQTRGEADCVASAWNAKFGARAHEADRAFVQPVLVPAARAAEPEPGPVDVDEEGKGSD